MARRKTVLARITGRVQGVWFRAWTQEQAEKRDLSGWVRNEDDGSVTALLSGPPAQVDEMAVALKDGPSAAQVEKVELNEAEPPSEEGFCIAR